MGVFGIAVLAAVLLGLDGTSILLRVAPWFAVVGSVLCWIPIKMRRDRWVDRRVLCGGSGTSFVQRAVRPEPKLSAFAAKRWQAF